MKKYIKFLAFFLILPFITNGCYTILWTPEDDFPDETSYESYDSYYVEDYHYYYDYPWWLSFSPPVKYRTDADNVNERDKATSTIRNNGNGRNTSDSGREVLNTPPPTRSYTPPSAVSDNSSETSTSTSRTESVESKNTNTNTRQSSGSNGNSTRNNDGNRNNGRGR